MAKHSKELHDELLAILRRYTIEAVTVLVDDILAAWGWELVRAGKTGDPRQAAEIFWLNLPKMNFEGPYQRTSEGPESLNGNESSTLGRQWGARLAQCPFDEAILTFTDAVVEWLRTCDLRRIMSTDMTEQQAMLLVCKDWGASLGVN